MKASRFLALMEEDIAFLIGQNKLVGGACYLRLGERRHLRCFASTEGEDTGTPVQPDTLYDLASLSKVVATAMAAMVLMDRGKIAPDTRVCDILPRFRHGEVQISHLLSHSSGLPPDLSNKYGLTREEMTEAVYVAELAYPTGGGIAYSDIGFILLGFVVEALTEGLRPFSALEIFAPLLMRDTDYLPRDASRTAPTAKSGPRGMIKGEVNDTKAHTLGGVSGSAGLFSTLNDCAAFADALLLPRHPVLSAQAVERLFAVAASNGKISRTLGWEVYERPSGRWIYHSGFTGTCLLLNRERQTAFVFLSNAIYADRDKTLMMEYRKNWLESLMTTVE